MSEWNARRLQALLDSDVPTLLAAAKRDGKEAELLMLARAVRRHRNVKSFSTSSVFSYIIAECDTGALERKNEREGSRLESC